MFSVKLVKIGPEGLAPVVGTTNQLPRPGQRFEVHSPGLREGRGGILLTSRVVRIVGAFRNPEGLGAMRFQTANSTYEISEVVPIGAEAIVEGESA